MRNAVFIVLLACTLAACGGRVDRPALPESGSASHRAELTLAIEAFEAGRYKVARHQLRRLVKEADRPELVEHARLYLGRIQGVNRPGRATDALIELAEQAQTPSISTAARGWAAETAARAERCALAKTLAQEVERDIEGALAAHVALSLARCLPPNEALARLEQAATWSPLSARALDAARRIAEPMAPHALKSALSPLPHDGHVRQALWPADLAETPEGAEPGEGPPGPARIALLLPLSGRSAPLGGRIRPVVDLLIDEDAPAAEAGDEPPVIQVEDAGSPTLARAVVARLTEQADLDGVVAALDQATADAVLPELARLEVPVLCVTLSAAVTRAEGPLWRTLHTPVLTARTAAAAGRRAGGQRAAILRPAGGYPAALAKGFARSWRAGGGEVALDEVLKPKISGLKGLARRLDQAEVDTLFVPAPPAQAATVMSHLAAEGVWAHKVPGASRTVTLLGPPEWYTMRLITQAGRYMAGALIPVPFARETEGGARFHTRMKALTGRPPSAFEALVFDALGALISARQQGAGADLPEILRSLTYEGATVGFRFADREAVSALYVLEMTEKGFSLSGHEDRPR